MGAPPLTPGAIAKLVVGGTASDPMTLQVLGECRRGCGRAGGTCSAHPPLGRRSPDARPTLALPPHPPAAGIKRLQSAGAQQDRYRMLLSDGEYSHSCMLATQLAELVGSNQLREGSIVTLHDYIANQVQTKK